MFYALKGKKFFVDVLIFVQIKKGELAMALINEFRRIDGSFFRTYKNVRNGNITHILTNEMGGKRIGVKAVNCDAMENPYRIVDIARNRHDIYEKANDGSTVLHSNGKTQKFPNLIFNTVCERIFGK